MSKFKLFCLPYAGGSSTVYYKWKQTLHPSIELYPVELAGRGKRFSAPLYQSMTEAVNDTYAVIEKNLDGSGFALFGHSMGTILVHELAHMIRKRKDMLPMHLFFSGRFPPHIKEKKVLHTLSNSEFIDEIIKIGGTPDELLQHKELLDLFISILKADYKMIETYDHIPSGARFDCDISILYGNRDEDTSPEDVRQWNGYSNRECRFFEFEGGHFFLNENEENTSRLMRIINDALCG